MYHLYVIRVDARVREDLRVFLQQHGVSAGIHYPIALPNLAAYAYLNHRPDHFPQATKASGEILSLPMYPELDDDAIAYTCGLVADFVSR